MSSLTTANMVAVTAAVADRTAAGLLDFESLYLCMFLRLKCDQDVLYFSGIVWAIDWITQAGWQPSDLRPDQ
jgi:hypothetical protein